MSCRLALVLLIFASAVTMAISDSPDPQVSARSFTISEQFGVSHPTQIVDFDFSSPIDPAQSYMLNAAGAEVPFQQLSNQHIAVSTDLPVNSSRSWTLYSG